MVHKRFLIAVAIIFLLSTTVLILLYTNNKNKSADKYGGKTPEETVNLFIKAETEGNYYLASRYYIKEKQSEEFMNFLSAERYAVLKHLELIKKYNAGDYSVDRQYYTMQIMLDGPDYYIRLYRNKLGVWKIIEI